MREALILLAMFSLVPRIESAEPVVVQNHNMMYIHSLLDQVIADPGNPKPRELLKDLARDMLRKQSQTVLEERLEALKLALAYAERTQASLEDIARLKASIRELESRIPSLPKAPNGDTAPSQEKPAGEAERFAEDIAEIKDALSQLMRLKTAIPPAPAAEVLLSTSAVPAAPSVQAGEVLPSTSAVPAAPTNGIQRASEDDKAAAQAYFKKGIEAYTLGNTERAVSAFKKSLELDPKNEWSAAALARIQRESKPGKPEKKEPAKVAPPEVKEPPEPVQTARASSRLARSVRELEKTADRYYAQGKLELAAKTLQWILKMDPGNKRAKGKLAKIEKELKR